MHRTSRRLLGGLLTLGVAAGLIACGSADDGTVPAAQGGWQFTDDLGRTVTLDQAPERIAGLNDLTASLWNCGIEPVAAFDQTSPEDDVAFEGHDLGDVAIVGSAYGEIDLEALAAADPDVIVTTIHADDSSGATPRRKEGYGFDDLGHEAQVAEIVPVIDIAGDWPGTAARTVLGGTCAAQCFPVLLGEAGPIGRSSQSPFVEPRLPA